MKNRKFIVLVAVALLVVISATLVACNTGKGSVSYTVSFVVDGEVKKTAELDNFSRINGFYKPTKEGYTFGGWYLDANFTEKLSSGDQLKDDLTLYAKFTRKSYTVEFVGADDMIIDSQTVFHGDPAIAPEAPAVSGMKFVGWDVDFTAVTANLTVKALYVESTKFRAEFFSLGALFWSYDFEPGDDINLILNTALDEIVVPEGLRFVKWVTSFDEDVPAVLPNEDIDIFAVYELVDIEYLDIVGNVPNYEIYYYGEYDSVTYTADMPVISGDEYEIFYSYLWTINGVEQDGTSSSLTVSGLDVGTYEIKVVATLTATSIGTVSREATLSLTVTPANMDVSAVGGTITYDGQAHNITVNSLPGDVVEYKVEGGDWTSNLELVNAGTYNVYYKVSRANHATYESTDPVIYTIEKKVVTATADDQTVVFGDDVTKYGITFDNMVKGEDPAEVIDTWPNASSFYIAGISGVGTYEITIGGGSDDNYTFEYVGGTLTVNKKDVTITADDKTITYGDAVNFNAHTYTHDGIVSGDTVVVTYTTDYNTGANAGTYTITPVLNGDYTNYDFTLENGTLTVVKKAVTITADDKTITYGDVADFNAHTYTHDGIVSGDTVVVTYTTNYTTGANAGTYTITPVLNGDYTNYDFTLVPGTLTVVKKDVTVTVDDKTIVYGEDIDTVSLTYTLTGALEVDTVVVTLEAVDYVAGAVPDTTFTIEATSSNENYNFNVTNGTLTVVKKDITVTAGNGTVVYGSEADLSAVTSEVVGLVGEDTIDLTYTTDYAVGDGAGKSFNIVPAGAHDCYNISFVNGELRVLQKDANVTLNNASVTYGDQLPALTAEVTGTVLGDSLDYTISVDYVAGVTAVGDYTITALPGTNNNYEVTVTDGTLTVAQRNVAFRVEAETAKDWSNSIWTSDDLVSGHLASGTLTLTATDFGTYTYPNGFEWTTAFDIKAGEDSVLSNYNVTFEVTVALIERAFEFTADNKSVTYDGNAHTIEVSDVVLSEDASSQDYTVEYKVGDGEWSTTVPTFEDAGNYAVSYRITPEDSTYYPDAAEGTFTLHIAKAEVTVTVDDKVKTYGEATPEFTGTVEGVVAGDTVEINYLLTNNAVDKNAGEYTITAQFATAQDNYTLKVDEGTLTVNQKAVTITADDMPITYGDAVNFNAHTYTHNGIVSGDTVAVTYTAPDYVVGANADETFAIIPSLNGTYSNYNFTLENGTLTVVKRDATITADDKTIVYGAGLDTITLTYAQENLFAAAPDGVTLEVVDFENSVPDTTFTIKATSSNENYNFTFVDGTLTVVKKDLTVTAGNATVVYGSEADLSAVTPNVVGLVGEDTIDVTFTTPDYAPGANAGETFNIVPAGAHDCYNITFINGVLTVLQKDANVTLNDASVTYGDQLPTLTVKEVTGTVLGDSLDYEISVDYEAGVTAVGDYTITALLGTNNNYNVTVTEGTLTVTQRSATVKALDKTISYRDVANLTEYEITGLLDGDSATVRLSTDYNPGDGVGTYEIVPFATNSNYVFTAESGTLTVKKARLDITNATQEIEANADNTYTFNKDLLVETLNGDVLPDVFEYVGIPTYKVASTYQFTATLSHVNYEGSVLCTFIIKSVDVGGTLYTIEDALNVATSGNVIVKANTAFSDVVGYYNGSQYYTVKSGVTLLLPYKDGDTIGYLSGGDEGGTNYDSHPNYEHKTNIQTVAQYVSLDIPSGVTVTVNGSLTVGAMTGKQDAGTRQNEITGGYSQINLYGNMVVSNGKLRVIGYIIGTGTITTTGTSVVTENMFLSGWMGGSQSVAKYVGDQTIGLGSFLFGGSVNVKNPQAYPYNQYELRSIQSTLVINYGSSLQGWLKIATSGKSDYGLKAKINEAEMVIISSNTSSAGVSNLRLLDSNAKITKSFAEDRVKLVLDGNIADGYCTMTVNILKASVSVNSQSVFYPIDGRTDIVVNSGTFTQSYKFKFLPGATLTIAKGATHTMNSSAQLIFYTKDFVDNATYPYPSAERGDAKFINNGTFNINGAFGGVVSSTTSGAKTVVGSGATLSVTSIESLKDGTAMDLGLSGAKFTLAKTTVTKTAQLSGGINMAQGTTYTYNGSAWA